MEKSEYRDRIFSLRNRIFRFAKSILGKSDEAEDTVQDIYEKLWRAREQLYDNPNIEAFAMVATRNLCYDTIRRRNCSTQKIEQLDYPTVTHTNPAEDLRPFIDQLIAELPEKQRAVMHLRDIENMEFDEIAQIMQMEITAVRQNLSRARCTVREKLLKIMNHGL